MKFILEEIKNMKGCIFCSLPKEGVLPKTLILGKTDHCFAMLNRYPYNSGHLMVVPNTHTAELEDLSEDVLLDLHRGIRDSLSILKEALQPQGYNVGMNLGEAGGAGIRHHLHYHIVPRWKGDTNYVPVIGETKVLPESLEDTYARLAPLFSKSWGKK